MHRVERLSAPVGFNAVARKLLNKASEFYSQPLQERRQQSYGFQSSMPEDWVRLVLDALQAQFNGKCAYCESPIDEIRDGNIDWFRPRGGVAESSRTFLVDHYWAQAFAWENMYLCCSHCNRSKGSRFPVIGARAKASAKRDALDEEQPVLLDPCRDRIEQHLLFSSDGLVSGRGERGLATVEILDLNREGLVHQRRREAARYIAALEEHGVLSGQAKALVRRHQPFLGLKRSLRLSRRAEAEEDESKARVSQADYDQLQESASVEADLDRLRARARFIRRVEIENIASIERLTLDFDASTAVSAPCFALLGVNGVGKSTILRAIALALGGAVGQQAAGIKVRDLLRSGAKTGRVTVWITGFNEPINMKLSRATGRFTNSQAGTRMMLLGYGSSRLLPHGKRKAERHAEGTQSVRIRNLFDPFRPLTDISRWLSSVPQEDFDEVVRTLKVLFATATDASFDRESGRVRVRISSGASQPFELLSDGYQSMLGLAADIISTMLGFGFSSMRAAQGIVLIDELGNHLHPTWRMRVLQSFRDAFPQIQFIFSTHDPLCLRGVKEGEIAVIQRLEEGTVYALENLPPIEHMRVDQLLASDHFGLGSMVDPWGAVDTEALSRVAAQDSDERTSAEAEKLAQFKKDVTASHLLSRSRPEQLYYEAVRRESVEVLAANGGRIDAGARDEKVIGQIRSLLHEARRPSSEQGAGP